MGLTPIRPWTFYWVSQLGMLPARIVYVNAGTQLAQIDSLRGHPVARRCSVSFALLGIFPLIAKKVVDWRQGAQGLRDAGTQAGALRPQPGGDRRRLGGPRHRLHRRRGQGQGDADREAPMGGDCLNTGCVPSKALIRSAKLLSQIARARRTTASARRRAEFDFADVMERVQRVIARRSSRTTRSSATPRSASSASRATRDHLAVDGGGRAADGSTRTLTTRAIVIAAGARPFVPPIPGIEEVGYLTSDTRVEPARAAARAWWCSAAGRSAASWRRPSRASARRSRRSRCCRAS